MSMTRLQFGLRVTRQSFKAPRWTESYRDQAFHLDVDAPRPTARRCFVSLSPVIRQNLPVIFPQEPVGGSEASWSWRRNKKTSGPRNSGMLCKDLRDANSSTDPCNKRRGDDMFRSMAEITNDAVPVSNDGGPYQVSSLTAGNYWSILPAHGERKPHLEDARFIRYGALLQLLLRPCPSGLPLASRPLQGRARGTEMGEVRSTLIPPPLVRVGQLSPSMAGEGRGPSNIQRLVLARRCIAVDTPTSLTFPPSAVRTSRLHPTWLPRHWVGGCLTACADSLQSLTDAVYSQADRARVPSCSSCLPSPPESRRPQARDSSPPPLGRVLVVGEQPAPQSSVTAPAMPPPQHII